MDTPPPTIPPHIAVLGSYPRQRRAHEHGLVVLSTGQPYWVIRGEDGDWLLLVRARALERLRQQVAWYDMEAQQRKAAGTLPPLVLSGPTVPWWWPATLWAAALGVAHLASIRWPALYDWGRLATPELWAGEWWRPFTALWLHSGIGHLVGNAVLGALFFALVVRLFGHGRAWLLVLGAATIGNWLNAWAHRPDDHFSIGASTAVFAAIGLLTGQPPGHFWRFRLRLPLRTWLGPPLAGLVLLAWFGTGDWQTDTSAHLFGYLAGFALGFLSAALACRFSPAPNN
jgi:rhomboid protease GluP